MNFWPPKLGSLNAKFWPYEVSYFKSNFKFIEVSMKFHEVSMILSFMKFHEKTDMKYVRHRLFWICWCLVPDRSQTHVPYGVGALGPGSRGWDRVEIFSVR